MTNKEIEKLLSMLDKKDLINIKKYLLEEQYKNNNKLRQRTFEEYLRTNKFGMDMNKTPRIYVDENVQKFTNGISLYIINKNFFNTQTPNLIKGSAKGAKSNHRFEYVSNICFAEYLSKILLNFSNIYSELEELYSIDDGKYTYAKYLSSIDNHLHTEKFDSIEVDSANIILNNPKYTISHNCPILKAESDIGKCYILGYKNQ